VYSGEQAIESYLFFSVVNLITKLLLINNILCYYQYANSSS
jgi:hypothetical protein